MTRGGECVPALLTSSTRTDRPVVLGPHNVVCYSIMSSTGSTLTTQVIFDMLSNLWPTR